GRRRRERAQGRRPRAGRPGRCGRPGRAQGRADGRGTAGGAGRRRLRAAGGGLQRAGHVGRDRGRGRAGRRAAGPPVRLRAGHGRADGHRRDRGAAGPGRRPAPGAAGQPGPGAADRAGRAAGPVDLVGGPAAALPRPAGRNRAVNPSTALARVLVDELVRCGVREAVIAPGSRSAPLALALHAADAAGRLRLHVRIDERSAGFLALGLAKASGTPAVVVTTSGTATANLHPAVLEASAAGVPLVVLTADRPPELRATGANQTVDQPGMYGGAVRLFHEVGAPEERVGQNAY